MSILLTASMISSLLLSPVVQDKAEPTKQSITATFQDRAASVKQSITTKVQESKESVRDSIKAAHYKLREGYSNLSITENEDLERETDFLNDPFLEKLSAELEKMNLTIQGDLFNGLKLRGSSSDDTFGSVLVFSTDSTLRVMDKQGKEYNLNIYYSPRTEVILLQPITKDLKSDVRRSDLP